MSFIKNKTKTICIFVLLLGFVYTGNIVCASFTQTKTKTKTAVPPDFSEFARSASCVSCHKNISVSHLNTAHALSSKPAEARFIKGSFADGKNEFVFNPLMKVKLDTADGGFIQSAYINGYNYENEYFDVVIGSGRKGQTYLFWRGSNLYQLPISYYTPLNAWTNSPGFPANFINFDRQITATCIECHGTYAEATKDQTGKTSFDTSKIIYGVDCERCHGPAAAHVAYQKAHPTDTTAQFIINIKSLMRQQKLDACALCHSGLRTAIQPEFSFKTGDRLDDFSTAKYNSDSSAMLDVHGNQFGLLTASKCFKMSQMDCSSCHNVHVKERDEIQVFSQRCINCHATPKHTSFALSENIMAANCVDCHMPLLASRKIVLQLSGNQKSNTPDLVRTHRVAIYIEKTKEFLKHIKERK